MNFLGEASPQNVGKAVSLFSYGSGCGAEFMSATVLDGVVDWAKKASFVDDLARRNRLSVGQYEEILEACGKMDFNEESVCQPDRWNLKRSVVYLGTRQHRRTYGFDGKTIL